MNNKISCKKRTNLNKSNYANFEFSDSNGKGFILTITELENKTIVSAFSISKGIEFSIAEERGV